MLPAAFSAHQDKREREKKKKNDNACLLGISNKHIHYNRIVFKGCTLSVQWLSIEYLIALAVNSFFFFCDYCFLT